MGFQRIQIGLALMRAAAGDTAGAETVTADAFGVIGIGAEGKSKIELRRIKAQVGQKGGIAIQYGSQRWCRQRIAAHMRKTMAAEFMTGAQQRLQMRPAMAGFSFFVLVGEAAGDIERATHAIVLQRMGSGFAGRSGSIVEGKADHTGLALQGDDISERML